MVQCLGVLGFRVELLRNYPRLKGVMVDQKEQFARGKEVQGGGGAGKGVAGAVVQSIEVLGFRVELLGIIPG